MVPERLYFVLFRVLQLMNLTDSRLAQAGNEKLELAMLSFFEQFRKIYIGDQVQKSSKVIGGLGCLRLNSTKRLERENSLFKQQNKHKLASRQFIIDLS